MITAEQRKLSRAKDRKELISEKQMMVAYQICRINLPSLFLSTEEVFYLKPSLRKLTNITVTGVSTNIRPKHG